MREIKRDVVDWWPPLGPASPTRRPPREDRDGGRDPAAPCTVDPEVGAAAGWMSGFSRCGCLDSTHR